MNRSSAAPPRANDARQDVAGAHVGACEPHAHEEERNLAYGGAQSQIGGHGDDGARARADAVDRRYDRLGCGAHRLHQIAGHTREGKQSPHVVGALQFNQRTDDVVHIATGAEVATRTGDDHRFDGL